MTSPFVWPWVRRGSERLLHDLSRYLLDRGHRVSVYSTGPEDGCEDRGGVVYHLLRQRWATGLRQFNGCHDFAFRLRRVLARCDADIVFCMNYFDAYAAICARRHSGARYPVVFHSAGILSRRHFRAVPLDAWFFRAVRREASLTLAVSQFAGAAFKRSFGIEPAVLAPPVVVENFSPERPEDAQGTLPGPRVMFVGDADERRKGARALCRAFALVRERHPQAQLLFSGHASPATQQALLDISARAGTSNQVTFIGVGRVGDLPGHYRSAAVTVLPAIAEAFGMVLAESLAAGTPVVGARHGGITEIIDDGRIGRLFDPGDALEETNNVRGLADAILQVLAQGKTPEVVAACRAKAQRYSWTVLGPEYERLLQGVVRAGNEALSRPPDPMLREATAADRSGIDDARP
jgi:phosphatidylinositol alpha-mannosyltransferase